MDVVWGWWVVGWGHSEGGEVTLDGGNREVVWCLATGHMRLLFVDLAPEKNKKTTMQALTIA